MKSPRFSKTVSGFTLVELLAVIVIMSFVAVLASSVLRGSGNMNQAVLGISLSLEQARAHAMANNTYVWVGFRNDTANKRVVMTAVAGSTGAADDINSVSTYAPFSKPLSYDQLSLQSVNNLPGMETADDAVASELASFTQNVAGVAQTFSNVIRFAPSGRTAIKEGDPSHWIQVGIQQTINTSQEAAFQIAGLTGQVRVFRP